MRNDKLYLVDIVDAADHVAAFLEGKGFEDFTGDELLKSATLQKLIVIGEAAARVSNEFKEKHTNVEWPDIVAFRNIAVHAYFSVNWRIVWETAKRDAPKLKDKISSILLKEFPE